MERTRAEHIEWCKSRALEYLPDDPRQAFTSMINDLRKHRETEDHPAAGLEMILLLNDQLDDAKAMKDFILGFN